jgi:hypothetical protein
MKLRFLSVAAGTIAIAAGLAFTQASSAYALTTPYYWTLGHDYVFQSDSPDHGNGGGPGDQCIVGTDSLAKPQTTYCAEDGSNSYEEFKVITLSGGWAQLELEGGFTDGANCLDYSKTYGLRLFPCNPSSFNSGYQKWLFVNGTDYNGGSRVFLQSARWQEDGTNMCVDASNQYPVRGYPCNGPSQKNGYQAWVAYDIWG